VPYSALEYWCRLGRRHLGINVTFSEDVVPLGDMKVNPGKIVRRIGETGRPALLTSHGRGVAVVQALSEYEAAQEEREFMRAVVAGLADIDAARVVPMTEVKRRLGLD
jgi:prevent-host-death family protein